MRGKQLVYLHELFDYSRFITDVDAFRVKNHYRMEDIEGLHWNTYSSLLRGQSFPSLTTVLILADFADLSLETYRKVRVK